jgi:hypothetical protein
MFTGETTIVGRIYKDLLNCFSCNPAAIELNDDFLVNGIEVFDSTYVPVENILRALNSCSPTQTTSR